MQLPELTTTAELLRTAYDVHADRDWMRVDGEVLTYADLAEQVQAVEVALVAAGVEAGDRVALYLENQARWPVIQYAASSLGAIFVPLNTRYGPRELERVLDRARPSVLVWGTEVYDRSTLEGLEEMRRRLPWLGTDCQVVLCGPDADAVDGARSFESCLAVSDAARLRSAVERMEAAVDGHGPAIMSFTSGTTGDPKGALLSHRGCILRLFMWTRRIGLRPDDCSILGSPLFWGFGCVMNSYGGPLIGSSTYMQRRFDPADFLAAAQSFVTHLQGAPTQYELMLNAAGGGAPDLSGLRIIQFGGTGGSADLVRRLRSAAPNAVFVTSYGLTEGGFVNTWTDPDATEEDLATTIGRAGDGNTVAVMELDADRPVGPGQVGEICVSGPSVMLGYYRPEGGGAHAGWLRTGDLATWDEWQEMTIVGRLKDAFRSGNMNIYPEEIEEVLLDHPQIAFAAAVDIPDDRLEAVPAAVVVSAELTHDQVAAYIAAQIADYKRPRRVRVVDHIDLLPMTPSGKIRKRDLRQAWRDWVTDDTVVGR